MPSGTTVARYWPVGTTVESKLDFTPQRMSEHLVADWVPSLPPLSSQTLIGWPHVLTEDVRGYLALRHAAGLTERQWKSFLSWMAGVCGTREVLAAEGYDWVAPVSAFYPENRQPVMYSKLPLGFEPDELMITTPSPPHSPLRPDYVAIKVGGTAETWSLALVEAKGTVSSLEGMATCPSAWSNQVQNAEVHYAKTRVRVDRHMVVAVRSNPGAKLRPTRRFQVRAWDTEHEALEFTDQGAVDVAAAALYGLCNNMGLYETARAISLSSRLRNQRRQESPSASRIATELRERRHAATRERERDSATATIPTVVGNFHVQLASELVQLIDAFASEESIEGLVPLLRDVTQRRRGSSEQERRADRRTAKPLVYVEPADVESDERG